MTATPHPTPPGWETDLAVLRLSGAEAEDRGDHLVVTSPHNPDFHWGNIVYVTDPDAVGDAERWVEVFHAAHPGATWVAIGLAAMPADADLPAWAATGCEVELDEVLTTRTLPRLTPLAAGYDVRQLVEDDDWEQQVATAVAENARTDEHDPAEYGRFARAQSLARRALSERGVAAFFGAFAAGGELAADLGIVDCGTTARYQAVGTDAPHRRQGLAAHLLGVAARWSVDRGCDRWVIITESTNPAGRVYRGVGFEPDLGNAQAYRRPAR